MRRRAIVAVLLLAACGDDDGGTDTPDAAPDAGLSPCGLPAPGIHCLDSQTLEYCDGLYVMREDCAAAGGLCGPDPASTTSAACIANGVPCQQIAYEGACHGDVLAYCNGDSLTVIDCDAIYADCVLEDPQTGYNCLNSCEVEGVPVEGICSSDDVVRVCEWQGAGFAPVSHQCPAGMLCGDVEETGWPGCVPMLPCAGVGPQGRCSGDNLVTCSSGTTQTRDCSASGEVCAYGGDEVGYTCAPPGATGARTLSGTVRYEDRPPAAEGLGAPTPRPARGVTVAVVSDASGEVLAAALTADDGTYTLRYDAPAGTMVHLLAATTNASAARPARVIRPDARVHGLGGASFPASDTVTQDLLATDVSGMSEAFNVFDQLIIGLDFVREALGRTAMTPLFAQWIRGTGDGTYWSGTGIFLLGEPLDDDGYDDPVILHELGHYVEDSYSRSDSPGGLHDGSPTDPRLAWSEGFATWHALAARNDPVYVDTNAAGGWSFDAEATVTAATATGPMDQPVSEDMVAEILWDTGDAPASDDDPSGANTGADVLRAAATYFVSASFADRGFGGVELVDWLDGWFLLQDLGSCSALRAIVGARTFPYDFNGPAGACP